MTNLLAAVHDGNHRRFPDASEITANINSRDDEDSQRRVLTRRELANERLFTGSRFCLTEKLVR